MNRRNNQTTSRIIRTSIVYIAVILTCSLITTLMPNYTFATTTSYTITYDDGVIDNMPTDESSYSAAQSVNISSDSPTLSGHNFLGWCTVLPTGTDGNLDNCSGTTYAAGDAWTLGADNNNLSLYAMWGEPVPTLYDYVADMSKGTQTLAQLRAAITVPTSADRTQDTSNSGVYEYNASVFGTASDDNSACTRADGCPIYYYRGVLENSVGSYGSDGSAVTYPNYVKLGNTCWRIVRTTGSGGVKMIYNGTYGATTSGSCANTQTNAQVTTQAFGLKGNSTQSSTNWRKNINRVGYTFNNTQSIQDSTDTTTPVATVFGSDSDPTVNNANSNIKAYIEDTWYASNMTNYTSKLEASAGYCNDRTAFSDTAGATALTTIPPYASSNATMYFGSYIRVTSSTNKPTLNCPRSTVDLYRYVTTSTTSYTSNELKYPVALLTADEAAIAGSGYGSSSTPYHANSYLRSGSNFWLLSPIYRSSSGDASGFRLSSSGGLSSSSVNSAYGVRPAISLTSGTVVASGTGTATDPWIVNP